MYLCVFAQAAELASVCHHGSLVSTSVDDTSSAVSEIFYERFLKFIVTLSWMGLWVICARGSLRLRVAVIIHQPLLVQFAV